MMGVLVAQALTGLATAASLFLAASGLSIIFGVTRVVNFAHGAFAMLGAYLAFSFTERLAGAAGFWAGFALAAGGTALLGVAVEMLLLRRLYRAPEFYQLLATFGLTLAVEDIVVLVWGPDDLLGRRAPGLAGAVPLLGQLIPRYDLFLIALAPLVLALLWLLFHRTRWGMLLRAAAQDRDMVAALGVDQRWLFTGAFALGVGLAGLGGALQLPREAVSHTMDLSIVVEVFVIVVIGGLGSVGGAFLAAILVGEINAFGVLLLPAASFVLVFVVMALVLVVRPRGLLGRTLAPAAGVELPARPWRPLPPGGRAAVAGGLCLVALLPLAAGPYPLGAAAEIALFALFAASLHLLMGVGGLVSFGHAAYLGLGAYATAALTARAGWPLPAGLAAATLAGGVGAALAGWLCVRLSGVYFAMLTLAVAQIVWSLAVQAVGVTGGDNGIIGVRLPAWTASPAGFYWLTLALATAGIAALRALTFARFGYALRAVRDNPRRAAAVGLHAERLHWLAFVAAGAAAGLAGGLFAFLKGSVFPDVLAIPVSVDALVMVLLGGLETTWGAVVGAVLYKALSIWLLSRTDHAKLVLGLAIVGLVLLFPHGVIGTGADLLARRERRR